MSKVVTVKASVAGAKRVYFAGKVGRERPEWGKRFEDDWRMFTLPRNASGGPSYDYRGGFDQEFDVCPGWRYVGPFFRQEHGLIQDDPHGGYYDKLSALCKQQIDGCDIVFCWIDSTDAFGTLAEIGYAAAKGKVVHIGVEAGRVADLIFNNLSFTASFSSSLPARIYSDAESMWDDVRYYKTNRIDSPARETRKRIVTMVSREPIDPNQCFVYLAREIVSGRLKIGTTQDIGQRMRQLQTGNPDVLELVAYMRGSFEVEATLHERFRFLSIRGEWFCHDEGILRYFHQHGEHRTARQVGHENANWMDPFAEPQTA